MANPLNDMKFPRLTAVITKLSEFGVTDVHGEAILKNPEELAMLIAMTLNKHLGITVGRSLGTVTLAPQSADTIIVSLEADGYKVSDWAKDILKRMPAIVDWCGELVVVTVADLGFKKSARYDDIIARAKTFGLELCPAGVGPALRRLVKDQSMGEWLIVAMEPITDSEDVLSVFRVGRNSDGLWLYADCGYAACQFDLGTSLVFVRGKQPSAL